MLPWRARAVPRQAPGTGTPPQAKNGVGRLPHEEAADAVVKKKSLRPW
ncbi:conserved domain protein [Actinomyces sp. oral taxon 175 str. F0384]|nr:conserved domain protein [Actinomyces sp. oral taxon 175 str. F0384]